jgi:hypothetical protein
MSKEDRVIDDVQGLGVRSAGSIEGWTELLGRPAGTKLSSIAREGAANVPPSGNTARLDSQGLRPG